MQFSKARFIAFLQHLGLITTSPDSLPHNRTPFRLLLFLLFHGFAFTISAQPMDCEIIEVEFAEKKFFSDADPRCDPRRSMSDTIQIDISQSGFYRTKVLTRYTISGNVQLNESFYILIRHPETGLISYPIDPNLDKSTVDSVDGNGTPIAYKVVEDDNTLTEKKTLRDAGVFLFREGLNIIEIHHYARIVRLFPQFVNKYHKDAFSSQCYEELTPPVMSGHLGGKFNDESIEIDFLLMQQVDCTPYDLALTLTSDKNTVNTEADTLSYDLVVTNPGPNTAFGITLIDTLPPFVSVFEFSEPPILIQDNVLQWQIRFIGDRSRYNDFANN